MGIGSLIIILLTLLFIRIFWAQLYFLWTLFLTVLCLAGLAGISAWVWVDLIKNTPDKFWGSFTFFAVVYTAMTLVFLGILEDIIDFGVDVVREIFRIK